MSSEESDRLFTLANTAALVLFNENGNFPRIAISQKMLADHGAALLKAYKETVVEPAMAELAQRLALYDAHPRILVKADPTIPEGVAEFRDDDGRTLARIENIGPMLANPSSSSGRTSEFGSENRGSNPCEGTSDVPTEAEFRAAGFTAAAINYPLSDAAVAWLCKFNGAPDGWVPPRAWRYAPNAWCQANAEKKAAEMA